MLLGASWELFWASRAAPEMYEGSLLRLLVVLDALLLASFRSSLFEAMCYLVLEPLRVDVEPLRVDLELIR